VQDLSFFAFFLRIVLHLICTFSNPGQPAYNLPPLRPPLRDDLALRSELPFLISIYSKPMFSGAVKYVPPATAAVHRIITLLPLAEATSPQSSFLSGFFFFFAAR